MQPAGIWSGDQPSDWIGANGADAGDIMPVIHRSYWAYIITNHPYGTLYVGVTNSLERRMGQHKSGAKEGFSKCYGLKRLVYFEEFQDIQYAIRREKVLKGWTRTKKISLIENQNPLWVDLSLNWFSGKLWEGESCQG